VSAAQPLLAARGAGRRFGARVALQPTDFDLRRGERVALVGPNGAGKSTLLALLAGALEPTSGSVERHGRVGWAPQRPAQYGRLSPRENLELFARLEGEGDPADATRRLLDEFELPTAGLVASDLSVGNRQRLNLAIALLGRPDALLLDEPTAALDPEQRSRLWERLERLRAGGVAVAFVTQYADEADAHADRVVALRDGSVVDA
jgi:ABC-2 type transport system ATP-binding protein